ncbi:MAG TPA: hypothetical protein VM098_07840 [Phycisphaerae bacterium]|nr:hypothetical protein [Phycisphaerae bacterium]
MELLAVSNPPEVIAARTTAIHGTILRESRFIRQPDFERFHADSLARL